MRPETAPSPLSAEHLRQDHDRMDRRFEDLIERAQRGSWRECDAVWTEISDELDAHMLYEEHELFPAFARSSPEAAQVAQELRAEHSIIRQLLDGLGLDIQLHLIRAVAIERFVEALRQHARRESETLYPWLLLRAPVPRQPAPESALSSLDA